MKTNSGTFKSNLSKVTAVTDKGNQNYITALSGSSMTNDKGYRLLLQKYKSTKVVLYKAIFPLNFAQYKSEIIIKKTGDSIGIAPSMLGFKKKLGEYLSGCGSVVGMIEQSDDVYEDMVKILTAYSNCN